MPAGQVACTNSKGLIWRAADGSEGSFRNNEQKGVAVVGKPDVSTDLKAPILTYYGYTYYGYTYYGYTHYGYTHYGYTY